MVTLNDLIMKYKLIVCPYIYSRGDGPPMYQAVYSDIRGFVKDYHEGSDSMIRGIGRTPDIATARVVIKIKKFLKKEVQWAHDRGR